jgi:hypothetical protein
LVNGQEIIDIPVLNPGNWFGQTRLREIGESFSAQVLIVEADAVSDAIDGGESKPGATPAITGVVPILVGQPWGHRQSMALELLLPNQPRQQANPSGTLAVMVEAGVLFPETSKR